LIFSGAHRFLSGHLLSVLTLTILIAVIPGVVTAAGPPTMASGEIDPYLAAAKDAGVPLEVLVAVAGAESGYHPWALDIEGRQVFCKSRAEAEATLAATATTNVDIGLMQINWRFWGSRLDVAKNDLLDPRINLLMGARILRESLDRDGSVWRRISNYHSGARHERDRYNRQVYIAYMRYVHGQVR
jgi:soluble lytic murein transglycosylase-like protein